MAANRIILHAPRWLLWVIGAGSVGYFFFLYGMNRVWLTDGQFGPSLGATCVAVVFAVVLLPALPGFILLASWGLCAGTCVTFMAFLLLFLWLRLGGGPAAAGPELRCLQCGYPGRGLPEPLCPECGGKEFGFERQSRSIHWRPILLACVAGAVLGIGAAEARLISDEAAFRREVRARGGADWSRPRAWPYGEGILIHQAGVFTSHGD